MIPNLAGVATQDLVEQISGGKFKASYINWSRTMHLLREHAPGWLPYVLPAHDGGMVHRAPLGGCVWIGFECEGQRTPPVPQAIMDTHNNAVPWEEITARDISDTHRRGVCLAAALTFGLAYELWAKLPLESGYAEQEKPVGRPMDGVWDSIPEKRRQELQNIAAITREYYEAEDLKGALEYLERQGLGAEEKSAVWSLLTAPMRSALKTAQQTLKQLESQQ